MNIIVCAGFCFLSVGHKKFTCATSAPLSTAGLAMKIRQPDGNVVPGVEGTPH